MPLWWNGRHDRLKIYYLRGCAGSSPAKGIFNFLLLKQSILLLLFIY